jgi:hypothetical protein
MALALANSLPGDRVRAVLAEHREADETPNVP